ncbi:PIN-like domain-containing protein [Planosporangium mesophilum]|uniref:PIN like domain-containing protein n=1 Tax=Planosporangium mesophilum TaxID=689768 RepID=A0A8J3TN03_9ACTN|nr:PIN-like domain-containing protein [Planosporangium mesophilum]NJC85142.1 hypothetical protein [Planosporangium mesophilum]GII24285.1 hypothetical protein Pme01_38820 [Planosporangium mesophilum]
MAGFSEEFRQYLPPDEEMIGRVFTKGVITLDANVLLDAYRYASDARAELLRVLHSLGGRLWVSHQVALEFHRNRVSVISGHGDSYREVLKAGHDFRQKYDAELAKQLREFANRVALPDGERTEILRHVTSGLDALSAHLNQLQARHGVSDRFVSDDPVLKQLQHLLDNKVGPPLAPEEEAAVRKEAQRRIEEKIPPGFKDAGKSEGDPCGDYLVWHQSLLEAKARSVPLLFVTRDTKEDWFLRVKGKTVSALPELILEARQVAGVDFVAMTTKTFLVHSQRYLDTAISKTTLDQAEAIRLNSRQRQLKGRLIYLLPEAWNALIQSINVELPLIEDRQAEIETILAHLRKTNQTEGDYYKALLPELRGLRLERLMLEDARRALLRGTVESDDGTIAVEVDSKGTTIAISEQLARLSSEVANKAEMQMFKSKPGKVRAIPGEVPLPGLLDDDQDNGAG